MTHDLSRHKSNRADDGVLAKGDGVGQGVAGGGASPPGSICHVSAQRARLPIMGRGQGLVGRRCLP